MLGLSIFDFGGLDIFGSVQTVTSITATSYFRVYNAALDAYAQLDSGDDAVAGNKGLQFVAAADEDIELINLSVTGTPRIFWDESEDQWVSTKGIDIGANFFDCGNGGITFGTGGGIRGYSANILALNASEGTLSYSLRAISYYWNTTLQAIANAATIQTNSTDSHTIKIQARDNGVGYVNVGQIVNAADPHIQILRDDTGVSLNAITDGLVLGMGAGANNEAANQGFGISIKIGNASSELEERASLDTRLVTATNGAEDVALDINVMGAGSMALIGSFVTAGLNLASGKALQVNAVQVVGARVVDARCDDAINSGDGTTDGVIDALRDAMIAHGLIAAA